MRAVLQLPSRSSLFLPVVRNKGIRGGSQAGLTTRLCQYLPSTVSQGRPVEGSNTLSRQADTRKGWTVASASRQLSTRLRPGSRGGGRLGWGLPPAFLRLAEDRPAKDPGPVFRVDPGELGRGFRPSTFVCERTRFWAEFDPPMPVFLTLPAAGSSSNRHSSYQPRMDRSSLFVVSGQNLSALQPRNKQETNISAENGL